MLARVYQASTNPESLGNRLLTLLPHLWFKVILWDEVSSVNRHLSFFKKFLSYIYKKTRRSRWCRARQKKNGTTFAVPFWVLVMAAIVVVAADLVVFEGAGEVGGQDVLDWARAAADDLDAVGGEHVECAFAHVASEKQANAHACHGWCNVRLAAAALWRSEVFLRYNSAVFDGDNGVMIAVTKVIVNSSISCW